MEEVNIKIDPSLKNGYFKGGVRNQYFTALSGNKFSMGLMHIYLTKLNLNLANLGSFAIGNAWSWSSTAMPLLQEDHRFKDLSDNDKSWIASIIFVRKSSSIKNQVKRI